MNKKIRHVHIALIASILCGCLAVVGAAHSETAPHNESASQAVYSLEGQWKFRPGDDMSWASPGYDDSGWAQKRIPQLWPLGGYPESNQFAWYRHTINNSAASDRVLQ